MRPCTMDGHVQETGMGLKKELAMGPTGIPYMVQLNYVIIINIFEKYMFVKYENNTEIIDRSWVS